MTEPWPNGYLKSQALSDPLDNPLVKLASARELLDRMDARFRAVEECNERALRLHAPFLDTNNGGAHWRCTTCRSAAPCRTRRALTGTDMDDAR